MAQKPLHSILRLFRVEKRAIAKIRFILEAYEGVAVVETIDPGAALIMLHIAPGCEEIVERVVGELALEYFIEPAESGNTCPDHDGGTGHET